MSAVKLTYIDGRGRAEIIRLTLSYLEIKFTEEYVTEKNHMEKLRADGKLLFQQLPLLEIDGKYMVQTNAILRSLARRGNLYGTNDDEASRVEELFEGTRDFTMPFLGLVFNDESIILKSATEKTLPRYLPIYNKVLQETGTGYLVGKTVTLADLGLLEPLLFIVEYLGDKYLEEFSSIQKFYKDMTENKKISAFLNGPHRKGKNTQAYVDLVKKVFY